MKTPDQIQKKIVLRAPLARVWSAISDARQFGAWFGVELEGPFVAGEPIRGVMRPTEVDPEDIDPGTDTSKEPTTLVELELKEIDGGTHLTVTESGFDKIPLEFPGRARGSRRVGAGLGAGRRGTPAAVSPGHSCQTSAATRRSHSAGSSRWYGCSDGSIRSRKPR